MPRVMTSVKRQTPSPSPSSPEILPSPSSPESLPPTPERVELSPSPPPVDRTLHHYRGDPLKPIGDYLKDVVPLDCVPDFGKDTLVEVPTETIAIMHSLGLEYKYFTDSNRMKRLAGVAPDESRRKRRIGSED